MSEPELSDALRSRGNELLSRENVVTFREGTKYIRGEDTGKPAIVFYVSRKLPKSELSAKDLLPTRIERVPVDVVGLSRPDRTLHLPRVDLRGLELHGASFLRADFHEANLAGVSLVDADLREATLVNANLTRADLRGANLRGADLTGALTAGATMDGVVFDDSTRWAAGFEPPATLAADVPSDLLGRSGEVERISDRLAAALTGQGPAVVLLTGRAGVGKSSIVRAVLDGLRGRFDLILVGSARVDPAAQSILNDFLGALGVEERPSADTARSELYQASLRDRHVLVVLDDVEFLPSGELADLLPRASSSAALISGREVELPDEVAGQVFTEEIGPLSQPETIELVTHLLGRDVPSGEAEKIADLTGGNPLYVQAVASNLRESSASTLSDEQLRRSLAELEARLRAGQGSDALMAHVQPEPRIARDYWTVDDHLGYGLYATAISAFVRHPATRPPLTIGIKAPWGAGKTSLMRMIQARVDPPANWETWEASRIRLTREARVRLRRAGQIQWWRRKRAVGRPGGQGVDPQEVTNYDVLLSASGVPAEEEAVLERLEVETPQTPGGWRPTVWFNPWMYQTGEQIWAGLAHEIISQITDRMERNDRELFFLRLNIRRIDKHMVRRSVYRALVERFVPLLLGFAALAAIALGGFFVAWLADAPVFRNAVAVTLSVGAGITGVGGVIQTLRFLREGASTSFIDLVTKPDLVGGTRKIIADDTAASLPGIVRDPGYEARLGYLHLVQADVKIILDLVATESRPVVVFVDDLDRCSPGAVAQVIEAINLFLAGEFPNCIFVLALEPAVVAAHVETAYKDLVEKLKEGELPTEWSTLGWRFLEKIVQLPLSLPPAGEQDGHLDGYLDALLHSVHGQQQPGSAPGRQGAAAVGVTEEAATDFAESLVTGTEPRPQRRELSANLVARLEAAIRESRPTLDTLPDAARKAQAQIVGDEAEELVPEAVEAANAVFRELYSDAQARDAIEFGLAQLGSSNAREMKRFVNLFRFYTFVAYQRMLFATRSAERPDARQTAKIAALAIRWPQFLNSLSRPMPFTTDTALAYLEGIARLSPDPAAPSSSEPDENIPSWANALLKAGLTRGSEGAAKSSWPDELNAFLGSGPEIGTAAKLLL